LNSWRLSGDTFKFLDCTLRQQCHNSFIFVIHIYIYIYIHAEHAPQRVAASTFRPLQGPLSGCPPRQMPGPSPSLRDRTFQAPTQRDRLRLTPRRLPSGGRHLSTTLTQHSVFLQDEVFCGGWSANPATNLLGKVTNCRSTV